MSEEIYQKRDILLAEIHADMKHLVKGFDTHVIEDKKYQEKNDKKVELHSKIIYGCLGALALFELILKVIK